jgi:hypothetical protein
VLCPPALTGNDCVLETSKASIAEYLTLRLRDASGARRRRDGELQLTNPGVSPLSAETGANVLPADQLGSETPDSVYARWMSIADLAELTLFEHPWL